VRSREGKEPAGTTEDELWRAKQLYDSAYHPETGEKVFLLGRMSFQVPGNMSITGCMLAFYKSTPAVIFWQWVNQSFNAIVNYSNRNASAGVTNQQLGQAYAAATTASVLTAVGLNKAVAASPKLSSGIIGRFVPMVAVAAANCVNIPLMRQQEIKHGINVMDENGKVLGQSRTAAVTAVSQVVPSRILMAAPAMFFPPLIMAKLERAAFLVKNPWAKAPITVLLVGACLTFSTPLCCALFPQQASISVDKLEPELQAKARKQFPNTQKFYYNKGL
jgi:tricarboxylate carrier